MRESSPPGAQLPADPISESRKYTGLLLVRQIFANENHCEVIAPGFQAGLKMALKQ
jgi:hypothetical protein